MSIQPIDLQTLFMRLSQVGKEQAAMREAAHVAQTIQGSEIAKRSEEQTRTVNETRDVEQGPEAVKDEEQGKQGGESGESGEEEKKKPPQPPKKSETCFRIPSLVRRST